MNIACGELVKDTLTATDHLAVLIKKAVEPGISGDRGGPVDTLGTVERYRSALMAGIQADSQQHVLKAINLLTTVNRGLGDTVWVSDHPMIANAGLEVTRKAIMAAQCLRAALGMTF